MLFPGQCPVATGKNLVFESLEFLGDVAFGCLERLFAGVERGHQVLVGMGDLDEVAVNPVVTHFQAGNSGLFALFLLVLQKKFIGVLRQAAQFVQLLVVTLRDNATIADQYRWFLDDRAQQQIVQIRETGQGSDQLMQFPIFLIFLPFQYCSQLGQHADRMAQGSQIPGTGSGQCDTREDALDITHTA